MVGNEHYKEYKKMILKLKELEKNENDIYWNERNNFSDYVCTYGKEIITPMLGECFFEKQFSDIEKKSIFSMLEICLCESMGNYTKFAIKTLEIEIYNNINNCYVIEMDAIHVNGNTFIIEGIVDDLCVCHGHW
jgi:hypothetical protein